MSDSLYLSDDQVQVLEHALLDLEVLLPRLDDLLMPSCQAPGGERVSSSRAGSRPPLSIHVLDVKRDIQVVLSQTVAGLIGVWGVSPAALFGASSVQQAQEIRRGLDVLAGQSWAPEAAEAVVFQAQEVARLVDPDRVARVWPREQVPMEDLDCPVMWSTSRRIAAHAQAMGVEVSRTTIRRWAEAGDISEHPQADGSVHYCLSEVIKRARVSVHDESA